MAAQASILLDDGLTQSGVSRLFEQPLEIIRCDAPAQVGPALARIEQACAEGLFAAGFFAYELGHALVPQLRPLLPAQRAQPLLWVGLFERIQHLRRDAVERWLAHGAPGEGQIAVGNHTLSRNAYLAAFARVQAEIAAGALQQVNLTFKHRLQVDGDPIALYRRLRQRQPVAHGGFVQGPDFHVLSLSPELFLDMDGGAMTMRPMKGTAPRGADAAADHSQRRHLRADAKCRAENALTVDAMRRDLARIAQPGSVHVPELFTIETYPTLHQMTSTIRGRLRGDIGLYELLCATFPCGSITGAPKMRAMQVIRELEPEPRGIYTGSLGYIGPGLRMHFNVAIRTLYLDANGAGEMGIGSGIVAGSDGEAEYEECLLKARFLEASAAPLAASPGAAASLGTET